MDGLQSNFDKKLSYHLWLLIVADTKKMVSR